MPDVAALDGSSTPKTASSVQQVLQQHLTEITCLRDTLNEPVLNVKLIDALHDTTRLPDKETAHLALQTIDVLHEITQTLQPGHLVLADHFLGYTNTKCLVAAVQLKVPDALSKGSLELPELAKRVSARPDRLRQVLRALIGNDIFSYDAATRRYSNNHRSELLRSDHWTQWHNWVELYGNEFYEIARGIPESIRKDAVRSAAQVNFDTDENMFTFFERQGWLPRLHRTLGGGAIAQSPGLLADYPWNEVGDKVVVDIGGGGGALIASLLRQNPKMRGGIFDLKSVIDHTRPFFRDGGQFADVGDRVSLSDLVAGDFFGDVPRYEVYTMKWCLHDWNDAQVVQILRNVRKAIIPTPGARLVVLESIMSNTETGRLARYGDINMMMTTKGQERNEEEWRSVVGEAGWHVESIRHLRNAWVCAIDLRP